MHGAMRSAAHWLLVLFVAAACSSAPAGLPSGPLREVPWGDSATDQAALAARQAVERGDPATAQALIQQVLAEAPRHVDALRVRQDLFRGRGRTGLLLAEAEAALAKDPDDHLAHYLAGRLRGTTSERTRHFQQAIALAPHSLWPWFGYAHAIREQQPDVALELYAALYERTGQHPLVGLSYADVAMRARQFVSALQIYERLRADPRTAGLGALGAAKALLALDRQAEAWPTTLEAARLRPWDPGVLALLEAWADAGAVAARERGILDLWREDASRQAALAGGSGRLFLASLLLRQGQPAAALHLLETAPDLPRQPAVRRMQRRLLLAMGDLDGFCALLRADVPRELVAAPDNELRDRWLQLLDGPWGSGQPPLTAATAVQLATALRDVGWLVEAESFAEAMLRLQPSAAAALTALRDEVRQQLAFEGELRRLLDQGAGADEPPALGDLLEALRRAGERIYNRDVVGAQPLLAFQFVGELVDPFAGGLAEHFARYNRHLVLGRRSGGAAEGMLFTRYVKRRLPDSEAQPLREPAWQLVVADRDVQSLSGVLGGDVAGLALLNHYLVDHDAVREWARSLAGRRRIAAADGNAVLTDALPEQVDAEPVDVSWRLAVVSPVQDSALEMAVFEMICHHEHRHLVDANLYLPISANVWRALGLVLQFGFSPAAVEAEMERRAELAALHLTPHRELVLEHIASFASEPDLRSPHHQGFTELARQLQRELVEVGVTPDQARPSRWHRLPPDRIAAAAQRLFARLPSR
jgi:tetratricopeptide (TPR) repeat protein